MILMVRMTAAFALFFGSAALADTLALTDARIIDGTGSPAQPAQTILVEEGVIRAIFPDGDRPLPDGTKLVDLAGRTVLPGLIDGHVHLNRARPSGSRATHADPEAALRSLLKTGVTTVRELAGDARRTRDLAQRQMRGELEVPAIYYSAVLYGPSFLEDPRAQASQRGRLPGTAPWSRSVTAESDVVQVIADARGTGATGIKLYASLDAPLMAALTQEAHRQGLKVWSHSATYPGRPTDALTAGADSLIHARSLIAEGRADVPDSFAEATQEWIRRLDFAETDPKAPRFVQLFSQMRRLGTIFEPSLYGNGDPEQPTGDWRDAMRDWSCKITGVAHRAGVTISAGSDTPAAEGALQQEMERLVECGLSPLEAVRAATLNNSKALGIENTHGTVEAGKVADLLVVAGDPAADIRAINAVHMVLQGGLIVARSSAMGPAQPQFPREGDGI